MKHNIESKLKVLDNCAILSDVPKHVELLKLTMLFFLNKKCTSIHTISACFPTIMNNFKSAAVVLCRAVVMISSFSTEQIYTGWLLVGSWV